MNKKQKKILIMMIVVIVGMFLYPPFHLVSKNSTYNMGYNWIFDPPKSNYITASVNVNMLIIQWVGSLIVGGLFFFLAQTSSKGRLSSTAATENDRLTHTCQKNNPETHSSANVQLENKLGPTGVRGWLLLLVVTMMVLEPIFGFLMTGGIFFWC